MNRSVKNLFARAGQDHDVWPVVLLLFAVLVPAVCLLWFMGAAMRNERFAARQKLADIYRRQLAASQIQLQHHWQETAAALQQSAHAPSAPAAFAACVQSGLADSVVLFDEPGHVLYPNTPAGSGTAANEPESKWAEAGQLEFLRKDFLPAARQYDAIAKNSADLHVAARAFQAEARCLVQGGQTNAAVQLVIEAFGAARFRQAADPQGRLIAGNAELMALELMTNHASPAFQSTARRLQGRLLDYSSPLPAAPQRRFLMKELQNLSPDIQFPTLAAEELAARWLDQPSPPETGAVLRHTLLAGIWQFTAPERRLTALISTDKLIARLQPAIKPEGYLPDARVALLPPGVESEAALVSLPAGQGLPGWRLTLTLQDRALFDTAANHSISVYIWTGLLTFAAMGVLTLLAIRMLRRQTALARLKNDLAATVSHELKTPLASMRVLVDTLLDSDRLDQQTVREYLQLIAQENERLSRLIQNFLTFSRMEKKKHTFQFAPLAVPQVIDAAVTAVRERLTAPGCRFEIQSADNLPAVTADADALTTALINLLDNACKYSESTTHIILRAHAHDGEIQISVQDHGIGIEPRETRQIFQPFHQTDQHLSRSGSGCGLGLSIVQFIMHAHLGSVTVVSKPGVGSTFTLSLPATLAPVGARKEIAL